MSHIDATDTLADRVVAITGAGNGLGRAYARAAAAAGARVVVVDVDGRAATVVTAEITAGGGDAVAVAVDVAATGAGEQIIETARAAFGRLDGFVANAGLLRPGALLKQSDDVVHRVIAVNVAGVIGTVTAAARAMVDGGSIVVILSGSLLGSEQLALYGTTKAAALGLVYGLSVELKGTGVRINGVAPRAHTAMSDEMGGPQEGKGGPPERVAPVVTYLLGDGSQALNGHVLRFDGTHLALLRPPRSEQQVTRENWDADAIAATIAGPLREESLACAPRGS